MWRSFCKKQTIRAFRERICLPLLHLSSFSLPLFHIALIKSRAAQAINETQAQKGNLKRKMPCTIKPYSFMSSHGSFLSTVVRLGLQVVGSAGSKTVGGNNFGNNLQFKICITRYFLEEYLLCKRC